MHLYDTINAHCISSPCLFFLTIGDSVLRLSKNMIPFVQKPFVGIQAYFNGTKIWSG
jgi:hypothetical protein